MVDLKEMSQMGREGRKNESVFHSEIYAPQACKSPGCESTKTAYFQGSSSDHLKQNFGGQGPTFYLFNKLSDSYSFQGLRITDTKTSCFSNSSSLDPAENQTWYSDNTLGYLSHLDCTKVQHSGCYNPKFS